MKKIFALPLLTLMSFLAVAQTVTLTFTGRDADNRYMKLDRVVVTNYTRGWQKTVVWPDTALTLRNAAGTVLMAEKEGFALSQNNPNPFNASTDVNLKVSEPGEVTLTVTDINGRVVETHRVQPQSGQHRFRVTVAHAGTYVVTARQNGKVSSIKMVCNGAGNADKVEYQGVVETVHALSLQNLSHDMFNIGDQMHPLLGTGLRRMVRDVDVRVLQ